MLPSNSAVREFSVGSVVNNVSGPARLRIEPGVLELRAGRIVSRVSKVDVVRHSGHDVFVYRARLLPPWMNFSIVVSDGQRSVLATGPMWNRRKLLGALHSAGFQTIEKITRIERGYEKMTFW